MIAYNTDDNKHYLGWPNGLTLDTSGVNEKLYWIDAKLHSIFSCSVDHCLGDIQALTYDHEKIIHPYSITVFEVIITSPDNICRSARLLHEKYSYNLISSFYGDLIIAPILTTPVNWLALYYSVFLISIAGLRFFTVIMGFCMRCCTLNQTPMSGAKGMACDDQEQR